MTEDSILSSSDEDDLSDCDKQEQPQAVDFAGYSSDESSIEIDEGADPEWKFLEEAAENGDGGDDKEKSDSPASRNNIRFDCIWGYTSWYQYI